MHALLIAGPTILASFLASMVEFVEALTVVLAVGIVRGWRSALTGAGAALALLIVLVAALGSALTRIPLGLVQIAVGALMLLFGLRWLRKAILRAAGVLALHDEAQAFEKETAQLRRQGPASQRGIDPVAFGASFKIVMIEGIEVVFIIIAIGARGTLLAPACLGAALALLAVIALGLWLHRPLAKVPENTLKFIVGALLSAFGGFWVGEGIGIEWPGSDLALLALVAVFLIVALALVAVCRGLHQRQRQRQRQEKEKPIAVAKPASAPKGTLALIGEELLGLFVDDGWLALGILAWVAVAWAVESQAPLSAASAAGAFIVGLLAVLGASALRRAFVPS